MTARDWTLLAIAAADPRPLQPVGLQKSLFLLSRLLSPSQLGVESFYAFRPYDYGPFCGEVYVDAERLRDEGLVHVEQPVSLSYSLYSATDEGQRLAVHLRTALEGDVLSQLDRIVDWITSLSFKQLVSAIYREYPEMKVNSVFQE